jgi:hypothetical protein
MIRCRHQYRREPGGRLRLLGRRTNGRWRLVELRVWLLRMLCRLLCVGVAWH